MRPILQRLQSPHYPYGRGVDNSCSRPSNPRCPALRSIRTRFQAVPQEECRSLGKMALESRRIAHSYPTSPRTLEELSNTRTLFEAGHLIIDGTFKSAPQLFTQMVGIHGISVGGWHIPLAYGLLPGKTNSLYTAVFEALDRFGPYNPRSVLCDNEIGLHNAVTNTWPNTTLRGCHFHYTQALWRHLLRVDLVSEYQVENSPIRAAFKMLTALPFVPENLITTAWRQLRPTLLQDMASFIDYYERTWVGTAHPDPLFPHSRWNQNDATALLLPRSSNIAEG